MDIDERRNYDLNQIIQLSWRYGMMADDKTAEGWIDLFAEDVRFTYQGGTKKFNSRDELWEWYRGTDAWTGYGPTTHLMGNVVVDFDDSDPDRATGRTTGIANVHSPDGLIVVRGLHYDDVFVRKPEGWRFAERHHYVDWEYQVPAHALQVVGESWDATDA